MKFFIFFLLFTFSFAHFENGKLDKTDLSYIKDKKVINVCINPDWSPIEFRKNDVAQGISIDILKVIANKIGLKLNFVYTNSWKESQRYLKEHKCDLTPTAVKNIQREKYAIFTRPYLIYDLAIITTQNKPYVTDISAVIDKTLTRKKGSGIIVKLKKIYPNLKIITPDNYKTMFELVNNNQAYATIATLPVFAYYKKKYNLDNLKIAGFTGWKYPLRMMINKNEPKLREILDCELGLISPKQTQKIYEKWIVKTKPILNYEKVLFIVVILVLVLLIIFVWSYILHKKNQELLKLSKVKSQFLANMSHEIRTPLNSLIGFIDILKTKPKECEKYLPLMDNSSHLLLSIVENIFSFSKLSKNEDSIKNREFYKTELENIIFSYREKAQNKGLAFKVDIDLPSVLYGDIDKIRNILNHLIDNAIKFTKKGEIEIILKYKNERLFISIKDTGIGIENKNHTLIFKPFVQLDNRSNKEYEGIGIGLSIAYKLVYILGGELKIKSELDKGSEFYFEIPIKKVDIKNSSISIDSKILVVEDNKANQVFMSVILKQLNIEFDIAQNGKEAVEMYKKYKYPVILMDINMPIMDGIEATKEIRKYEKNNNFIPSKIIAVTANVIDGKKKFLSIGMDDYIEKPVNIEKLKNILK